MKAGETVLANAFAALGLPYKARIEAIKEDRARIRPLEIAPTAGAGPRAGEAPTFRARWVKLSTLQAIKKQ